MKSCAYVIEPEGVVASKVVKQTLPTKQLIGAGRPLELPEREWLSLKYEILPILSKLYCNKFIYSCPFDSYATS